MRKIITISSLFFYFVVNAQVFSGSGGAIQDNGQETFFPITVSGLSPSQIDSTFGLEQVCINITHPAVTELYIFLQSPAGTKVQLILGSSSNGADLVNTCLEDQAGTSVTLGNTPYTGNYRPVGFFGRFNTGQPGNGNWNLIVKDGYPVNGNAGTLNSWSIKFGNSPSHPVIFQSSNLPIVFINTSQPITEIETVINMGIIDNGSNRNYVTDAWNGYNGKASIHLRGSSSKSFEKKPFTIETLDALGNQLKVPLLGMPAESDWILIASYQDKTLLRPPFTYDLYRSMGHYAARYRNVEVIIDNEYRGVYSLVEKLKRDSNRIDIKKLKPTDNVFPDFTGGYIIKIDRTDEPGWYSQFAGNCIAGTKPYFHYVYPDNKVITTSQQSYIKDYVNSFETVMSTPAFSDPVNGYPKYIDVNSFVDYFIINELSKNVDAYRLSTFLYKENIDDGGKMFIGPVWDYDLAWHNCNYGNSFDPTGWAYPLQINDYPIPTWWIRLMQDPVFVSKVNCRWYDLRKSILSINYLNNYIDASANALNEAQQRNFRQWPILGAYINPNPQNQAGANYWGEVADIKNWIAGRVTWMDANFPGACFIGMNEIEFANNNLVVYPNPAQLSTTFSIQLEKEADVSLCITDVVGKEVARFLNTNLQPGENKIVFNRNQIDSGVYLYQLQINNTIKTGKVIMQ